MPAISEQVLQDLAPTGKIRVAINYGMPVLAQRDPESGEPKGITIDLANELGRRLQVPIEFITFDAAGKILAAIASQTWDVTFLARDPVRAEQILFTPPYLLFEGTYLVKSKSRFSVIDDLDQPGVRIAIGKGAAYDLYLTRTLKNATVVRADTSAGAVSLFESEGADAAAGVRQPLELAALTHPELRVIPGRFTAIEQAMGVVAGRNTGFQELISFIEEMKSSGFVANLLVRHNKHDATVAP
jgi:polar amino acid transport system substrate-binding protein